MDGTQDAVKKRIEPYNGYGERGSETATKRGANNSGGAICSADRQVGMTGLSRQFVTKGIVLTRTDYGEADRIITFLTPDHGKVKALAKSVRKSKSKLAGGLELFSVSELTFIVGRGEINTLISSRLVKHYGNIVKDLDRTQAAYGALKLLDRATEDQPEEGYFNLLQSSLAALDDSGLDPQLTLLWLNMQLLKLSGHAPNLTTDITGAKLKESTSYNFYLDHMRFAPKEAKEGKYSANHIKFLRLGFHATQPKMLSKIKAAENLITETQPLIQTMLQSFVRV